MKCPHCGEEISEKDFMPVIISTGEEFEQFLCDKINAQDGMKCEKTKTTGDQGVDLIVRVADKKVAVQCKLYSDPVGNSAVQEVVAGRILYKCDIGCVVTNSTFTGSAKELAAGTDVVLLHYKDVLSYFEALKVGHDVDSDTLMRDRAVADGDYKAIEDKLISELPKDEKSEEFGQRIHDFGIQIAELVFKCEEYKPSLAIYRFLAMDCLNLSALAKESGMMLQEERWYRFGALFFKLAGVNSASEELLVRAKQLFKARYRAMTDNLMDEEFCFVPSVSDGLKRLFWCYVHHYGNDTTRIMYKSIQGIDRGNLSPSEREAYDNIVREYEKVMEQVAEEKHQLAQR